MLDWIQIIELPTHKFFVGTQFHPEFNSRPGKPSPLFLGKTSSELHFTLSDTDIQYAVSFLLMSILFGKAKHLTKLTTKWHKQYDCICSGLIAASSGQLEQLLQRTSGAVTSPTRCIAGTGAPKPKYKKMNGLVSTYFANGSSIHI